MLVMSGSKSNEVKIKSPYSSDTIKFVVLTCLWMQMQIIEMMESQNGVKKLDCDSVI